MKILISINTSWNVYNFRSGLIRAFVDAGFEVAVAAPNDAYSDRLAELGCRHIPFPMDNKGTSPQRDLRLYLRYLKLFRAEQPDIFLGYTIKPNIYGSLAAHKCRIPVINNVSGLGTAFIRNNWLTKVVKGLYRKALSRSATVFFQNDDDRSLFVSGKLVVQSQTALLPGSGIDLQKYRPKNREISSQNEITFLLIARLLWDKGVGEYAEAARLINKQKLGAKFQLLGFLDVENRTAVPKSTVENWTEQGLIKYLGASDDVRPHIAAADCVVLPSYREGTPRSLLEAAAMGKPLIATDVPGCREVIDEGQNGFLCDVRNAENLAQKMQDFIALSPEQQYLMGASSRNLVEKKFDETIVIEKYLRAISQAVG